MDTGVLPVGRFPNVAKRSSCELGSLGSYFFLLSCIWITREIIATMTMQKVSNSSHVTIIVPPFNRGQKKHHPPKKIEGNRLPGRCWQHREQHITPFDRLQGKKRGVSCGNAVIRPARESVRQAEIYLSPDFRIISFRIIPKSNTTAANTPQTNMLVYQGADCIAYSPGCVL